MIKKVIFVFCIFLASLPAAEANQLAGGFGTSSSYISNLADLIGDSRTADAFVVTSGGVQQGLQATNWFVAANMLNGNKWNFNLNQGASACRTDQYLSSSNLNPILSSSALWTIFGYPIINNLFSQTGNSVPVSSSCTNTAQSFPYTDNNGNVITLSNVAYYAANDVIGAALKLIAAGKWVVLTDEPGNTSVNNTLVTVASGTGSITTTTLTITACTSCYFYARQTLSGTGISGTTWIVAQLTGVGGATCPNPGQWDANVCNGGIGTYSVNNSQSISSEAISGQYSTLAAMYEFNAYIKAFVEGFVGGPGRVFHFSANSALTSASGSTSAVGFLSNLLLDGVTHFNNYGGYLAGVAFNATGIPNLVPTYDNSAYVINDYLANNPRQLIQNPLFNTTTGGTLTTCTASGGNATPPANWIVACSSSATTVTMTTPADASTPNAYGNDFQIVVTNASAADTVAIGNAVPGAPRNWNLTDWFQAEMTFNVTAGTCIVYNQAVLAANATNNVWGAYGGATTSGSGISQGPNVAVTGAYTAVVRTPPAQVLSGSTTKSYAQFVAYIKLPAAGANCTVKMSRPSFRRVFHLNTPLTTPATFGGG